ncbi:hypothetical protein EIN_057630 [Entamoeba invadens IP1]|uniref:hypothetical protein n=1 Tax=Entamoeba invadens IP1 TaxID=370355 RepID=UPI0002C3E30A|nr:hypothetical protein EIN_057630 [Entamoeba invadens IP1]ELP93358.1 hypothetical protein EIN_057630 [Entamoeba invadens IP1]|eukprot:XP_004260129.1 hypothetical protein EIN_057630 [Entamoeba invadens IP1]
MSAEQQQAPRVMWPYDIEDEANFSVLSMFSVIMSLVSFFYKSRLLVLGALLLFVFSVPHKQKSDLSITSLMMSAAPAIGAVVFCYFLQPENYF